MNHTIKQLLLSFWSIRRFSYPQSIIFALPFGLIVCLFVLSLSSHSSIFHSFGDITIAGEGLQILTYARHLWPLRGLFSLPHLQWHGASVYNGHLQGPVTLCRGWNSNTNPSACRANALTHCATATQSNFSLLSLILFLCKLLLQIS